MPLATSCTSFITTVLLHDDVIPRLTPASVGELLKELLQEKQSWMGHLTGKKSFLFVTAIVVAVIVFIRYSYWCIGYVFI
jgi:hypothetical protein